MGDETPPRPINRWEFLQARLCYLADLRNDGYTPAQMREACNLSDERQVERLLQEFDRQVAAGSSQARCVRCAKGTDGSPVCADCRPFVRGTRRE